MNNGRPWLGPNTKLSLTLAGMTALLASVTVTAYQEGRSRERVEGRLAVIEEKIKQLQETECRCREFYGRDMPPR